MQFSGNGVGFHLTQPTREQRVGVLNATDGVEHDITGPVSPGDSGGPVADLTDGNTAFGIVDTVGVGVNPDALTVVTPARAGRTSTTCCETRHSTASRSRCARPGSARLRGASACTPEAPTSRARAARPGSRPLSGRRPGRLTRQSTVDRMPPRARPARRRAAGATRRRLH